MQLSQRYPRAIVTGASRGLGKAFTEMLLAEGVEVWGSSRTPAQLLTHERLHPCELDLCNPHSLAKFLEHIMHECPGVELVINNAGASVFSPFESYPVGSMEVELDLLLLGPIRLSRAFYPVMCKRGSGALVNVSSLAADFPIPLLPLYNAAKAGLSRFTQTLILENVGSDVCILDFQAGDYQTSFNTALVRSETPNPLEARVWEHLERHRRASPKPGHAARCLRKALKRGRSGSVRSGSSFQSTLAPLLARTLPEAVVRRFLRAYYGL